MSKTMSICENEFTLGDDLTFACPLPEGHEGIHRAHPEEEDTGSGFSLTWSIGDAEREAAEAEREAAEAKKELQERIRRVPLGWAPTPDEEDIDHARVYVTEVPNAGTVYTNEWEQIEWTFWFEEEDGFNFYQEGYESLSEKNVKEVMAMVDDKARTKGLIE